MHDVPTLVARVEFIFEHWIARHGANPSIPRRVVTDLEGGRRQARALAQDGDGNVLLHGDLHPANVLDGGAARGLVAIDPRPCVGDPAFDAIDWVFWSAHDRHAWKARSRALASALDIEDERLWRWCTAFAALLAANRVLRGAPTQEVDALLDLTT